MYDRKTYNEIRPIYTKEGCREDGTGRWRESLYMDSIGYRLLCEGDADSKYGSHIYNTVGGYRGDSKTINMKKSEAFSWATEGYDKDYAKKFWDNIISGKYV